MDLRMMWDAALERSCAHCDMHAIGDELHVVFECPAPQRKWDKLPGLFEAAATTMQSLMWQDITQVGTFHHAVLCFACMRQTLRARLGHVISPRQLEQDVILSLQGISLSRLTTPAQPIQHGLVGPIRHQPLGPQPLLGHGRLMLRR